MKSRIALTGLVLALLPLAAPAAPVKSAPKAAKTAVMYECRKCHMKVSAAVAKKDGYKDSMDGGKLVPVKAAKPSGKLPNGPTKLPKGAISM